MNKRIKIENFDRSKVLHPHDQRMMERLDKIPGVKSVIDNTVVKYRGTILGIEYSGNGFEINEASAPSMFNQLKEDCDLLGLNPIPRFDSMWEYSISSFTVGGDVKRIIFSSGAMDLLQGRELDFLAGHEIGHILTGHIPYHMLVELLYSDIVKDDGVQVLAGVIKLPMLEWYRNSHLSADRIGLLCCQDINVAIRTMMKIAGCPQKYYANMSVDSFIKQAEYFEESRREKAVEFMQKFSLRASSMPWMVMRAKELLDWYKSGDYQKILEGAK